MQGVVYSLSFAGNCLEKDLASDNTYPLIDERMKIQLRNSYQALLSPSANEAHKLRNQLPPKLHLGSVDSLVNKRIPRKLPPLEDNYREACESIAQPLPKSIHQIRSYLLDEDPRPMIITEIKSPYRIVAVNEAWENLCGYTREECKGRSVGKLLQGPETDMKNVTALLSKLLVGEEANTVLTNYTKSGRKFKNSIRVGPVVDEMGKTVNFVGLLREVNEVGDKKSGYVREKMQLPFIS
jgi:PAS domain S-box-containing protein